MLEKIDSSFIHITQWAVRQIEIFTSISRRDITEFITKLLLCLLIIPLGMLVVGTILTLSNTSHIRIWEMLSALNCIMFFNIWRDMKHLLKKENSNQSALPKEIHTRKKLRKILLFSVLVIVAVPMLIDLALTIYKVSGITSTLPEPNETHWLIQRTYIFIDFFIGIYLVAEYLLCTTSLPPGEKEKRRYEKETRGMVPAGIKN